MIDQAVTAMSFDEHLARIRRLTDEVLIPREQEMVALGAVPPDIVADCARSGLFAITLPREHGGLGWTVEQQVRLTFEFTRASCVYRSRFSTTIGLASQILLEHGTDEQRAQYLPAMAAGDCVAAFALTETEAGSDASNLSTVAERDGADYVLDGDKCFITNGEWADVLMVFARTPGGISAFLVDPDLPGVRRRSVDQMNGHAEGPVAEIAFRGVRVGAECLVGPPGEGLRLALRGINHARTHVAATAVGQATRILTEAARYAADRPIFDGRLSELGQIQAYLGTSYAELEAARSLVLDCARQFGRGNIPRHQIAAAKYFATEMVGRVADRAVQILGGNGIAGPHPIPRMWRDVRALRIYEGASELHERNLGRHVAATFGAVASPG